jgi:hypothetical protein
MKKVIFSILVVSAMIGAVYSAYNYRHNRTEMSVLALTNVEALASGENVMCPNGCLDNGNGCLCHYWFPTYKEAK